MRVQTSKQVIAMTFDDGPDPAGTVALLALLEKHGAKATFFMVGEAAECCPELVQEVAAAGHLIGNHGYSHKSLPNLSARHRRQEFVRGREALHPHGRSWFRPPYGHQNLASFLDVWRTGCEVVGWSVKCDDYLDYGPDRLLQNLRPVQPGDIILMHDGLYDFAEESHADRSSLLAALDRFIPQRQASGYEFVTVSQLVAQGKPVRVNWYRQGNPGEVAKFKRRPPCRAATANDRKPTC